MKTIIITLFLLVIGFFQFYFSDPDIRQSIPIGLCLLCVFSIGILLGGIKPKPRKQDESIEYVVAMAVKDVAALGMDNNRCKVEIQQLKNDKENNRMNEGKLRKQVTGLTDDLKKANARIQELQNPIIQETC